MSHERQRKRGEDHHGQRPGRLTTLVGIVALGATSLVAGVASTPASAAPVSPPRIFGSASLSDVPLGGETTLEFVIANPNPSTTLTGVGFSDNLPSGLVVATPSNGLSGSCVARNGRATYQQGPVSGSGALTINGSSNAFVVFGPDLNLAGGTSGPTSSFTEVLPIKAEGSYTLGRSES